MTESRSAVVRPEVPDAKISDQVDVNTGLLGGEGPAVGAVALEPGGPEPITQRSMEFHGGHLVYNPHAHRFRLIVRAAAPLDPVAGWSVDTRTLQAGMNRIAEQLSGKMLVWEREPQVNRALPLHRPLFLPVALALEDLDWAVRPTVENMALWATGVLYDHLAARDRTTRLVSLELVETDWTSVTVAGDDVPRCSGYPGPVG